MDIKSLQTKYMDIIKDRYVESEDEDIYFKNLINSKNLKVLNEIIYYWRANGIEEFCLLTSSLLKKTDCFEEKITEYYRNNNFSNYLEEFGKSFLNFIIKDENKLNSFVAEFELAMKNVNSENRNDYFIETKYNLNEVTNYILSDGEYPCEHIELSIIKVSPTLENNFCIINNN